MNVNDDFSQRTVVHGRQSTWEDTRLYGVRRCQLDRVVDNLERITSLVEFAENSALSTHEHPGGEEILVLSGVFEDSYGSWPEGSYIRYPPGTVHAPHSDRGCVVLVKHCQFSLSDKTIVHANINKLEYIEPRDRPGVSVASMYKDSRESVRVERWAPNAAINFTAEGGAEIIVLKGSAVENSDSLQPQSWLRVPIGGQVSAIAGPEGTLAWIKTNHLKYR